MSAVESNRLTMSAAAAHAFIRIAVVVCFSPIVFTLPSASG
jgi:hypothetical protein